MPLPDCVAVSLQVPDAMKETAVPETVQTVDGEGAIVTARPELALTVRVACPPIDWGVEIAPNVMLCASLFTVKLCEAVCEA